MKSRKRVGSDGPGALEHYWQQRFDALAQEADEDHRLAGWSKIGLHAQRETFFRVFRGEIRSPLRVLDLGCGPGAYARALAADGHQVVGLDLGQRVLGKAQRKAAGLASSLALAHGDLYHAPFVAESFDVVLLLGVLQILSDSRQTLSEIRRLLRPGGRAFVIARNYWYLANRITDRAGTLLSFRPGSIRRQVRDFDLCVTRVVGINVFHHKTSQRLAGLHYDSERRWSWPCLALAQSVLYCATKRLQ
jgi:SAM-dependent methyltransferase